MMHSQWSGVGYDLVVVGAGASGALVTAQHVRQGKPGRLALIGVGPGAGRGVAYDTPFRSNLLNVPAWNMSAFPDDPGHFQRWLAARTPGADQGTFAPRLVYGAYLEEVLAEALRSPLVSPVPRRAVDLAREGEGWRVLLDDGTTLAARRVVLALGNLPPNDPLHADPGAFPSYYRNPWDPAAATGLAATAPVLLIGTGLTMIDVALSLEESGHEGPVTAISRRGWLPRPHAPYTPRPQPTLPEAFQTPKGAFRWIREQVRGGAEWRAVIDGLRPHSQAIWRGWSVTDRARFLRHAQGPWDIHRHRMAPEIAARLARLRDAGRLTVLRGRPLGLSAQDDALVVRWRSPEDGQVHHTRAARVVNCTGPNRDYHRVGDPLIQNLRMRGLLTPDPLRLGWETSADGQLHGADGTPVPGVFAMGPLRIGGEWESLAIPELRGQAAELVG